MSRCTGHCCKGFTIDVDVLTDPTKNVEDGDYIRDMLILLEPIDEQKWRATCRHFDGTNCTAYEQRPRLCINYPYGKKCTFSGCTYTEECAK